MCQARVYERLPKGKKIPTLRQSLILTTTCHVAERRIHFVTKEKKTNMFKYLRPKFKQIDVKVKMKSQVNHSFLLLLFVFMQQSVEKTLFVSTCYG